MSFGKCRSLEHFGFFVIGKTPDGAELCGRTYVSAQFTRTGMISIGVERNGPKDGCVVSGVTTEGVTSDER